MEAAVTLAPLVDRELEQSCRPSHPSGGCPSLHGAHVLPRLLWPWGRHLALEKQAGSVLSVQTPLSCGLALSLGPSQIFTGAPI